ncbi:MAG: hypothetical protein HFI37_04755 [Lachnospiraceae bacterium]|nr:hypothetical protein [Lachnospiraceae bacterium]
MTKKKSKGLTFIFSLMPGAGEMYMGFMKQGVSMMGLFFIVIAIAAFLDIGPLLIVLPIIWCYSFFNVHNISSMSDEEFYALEDDYIFHVDRILPMEKLSKKQNKILAWILILAGTCVIWNQFADYIHNHIYIMLPSQMAEMVSDILYTVPQLVVALVLIGIGIHMVRGKKVELDKEELREEEKED